MQSLSTWQIKLHIMPILKNSLPIFFYLNEGHVFSRNEEDRFNWKTQTAVNYSFVLEILNEMLTNHAGVFFNTISLFLMRGREPTYTLLSHLLL